MANNEHEITLGVLNAVHDNSGVTQRTIAGDLGIALGLTNSYLKRCIKMGLIKVQQAPANRYSYYLTPQGFSEKTRLAGEFLVQGFQFFRTARVQCAGIFAQCSEQGQRRIALHGLTDLAEIAVLCAKDHNIDVISITDTSTQLQAYSGIPVLGDIPHSDSFDVFVVTDLGNPQREFDKLVALFGVERVFAPDILKVSAEAKTQSQGGDQ